MFKNSKIKKVILGSIAAITLFSTVGVFAEQVLFNFSIPKYQNWVYTEDGEGNGYITGTTANNALVSLEGFRGINSVTFYSGAWQNNGSENITFNSSGTVMYRSDFNDGETDAIVNYAYTYGQGQKMGMNARNHNWSLNKGDVSGVFDYH